MTDGAHLKNQLASLTYFLVPFSCAQCCNAFGSAGAEALVDALPALKFLEHCQLSTNRIGDAPVLSLAKVLERGVHSALTNLMLSRCDLTLASLVPLIRSLKHCPSILMLDVRENNIDSSDIPVNDGDDDQSNPAQSPGARTLASELSAVAPECQLQVGPVVNFMDAAGINPNDLNYLLDD